MDSVQLMRVFVRVAQRASFAAAARDLRMSRAAVTRHVAALEARGAVRLFDRTTRSVRLTEAGQLYLERCLECLQAFDEAEAAMGAIGAEPRGRLRVAAPFDFARHLPAIVAPFLAAHPAITLDLRLSNRTLDMVDEGIDVYLRVTRALDPQSVARPLARTRIAVWAAPAYLRRHGRPRVPADLATHRFAVFDEPPLLDELLFERGRRRERVRVRPAMVSNSGELLVAAVVAGEALAAVPSFLLPPDPSGLEVLLPDWTLPSRRVYAVYPHRRFVPAKVRLFVEALRAALGDPDADPWWPGG